MSYWDDLLKEIQEKANETLSKVQPLLDDPKSQDIKVSPKNN